MTASARPTTEIASGSGLTEVEAETVAAGVLSGRRVPGHTAPLLEALGSRLDEFLDAAEFNGETGQVVRLPAPDSVAAQTVLLVGLGEEADHEVIRRAAGWAGRSTARSPTVATDLHLLGVDGAARAVAEGFLLGQYRFDPYRSQPRHTATERLVLSGASPDQIEEAGVGAVVAAAVAAARDLVLEPAAGKAPADLAQRMADLVTGLPVEVEVLDEQRIAAEGLGGVAGVGAGSTRPPRLVRMVYRPGDATAALVLVGKGITFDSGGLSIKPAVDMEAMKTDMSGAAAVVAALWAVARLGLPVRVEAIAPLADNLPSGAALKPGDVLKTRNGRTIEVLNTDAEGRLVLADGLALAVEARPDLVVDVATLTGACKIALGEKIAGVWSNQHDALERVLAAGRAAGEAFWPMPLAGDYRKLLDSDLADMKNVGGRFGGAIIAALLLAEFVGDTPWVHLDIAGPARWPDDEHYQRKGGSGFAVRTLVALCEEMSGA